MNHAYLLLLDTSLRSYLHNQIAKFPLSTALHASCKLKNDPAIRRTFVRKGKVIQVIPATSLF
jgi:hypothetical protein